MPLESRLIESIPSPRYSKGKVYSFRRIDKTLQSGIKRGIETKVVCCSGGDTESETG